MSHVAKESFDLEPATVAVVIRLKSTPATGDFTTHHALANISLTGNWSFSDKSAPHRHCDVKPNFLSISPQCTTHHRHLSGISFISCIISQNRLVFILSSAPCVNDIERGVVYKVYYGLI